MALDKNTIKSAKTTAKTAPAGAAEKKTVPAGKTATAKVQTSTAQKTAENLSNAPVISEDKLGVRSNDLAIRRFAFTEHSYDNSTVKQEVAEAAIKKNADRGSHFSAPAEGKDEVSFQRPRAVAVEVENISQEPVKFLLTKVVSEEVGETPYAWGLNVLADASERKEFELAPGATRWLLLSELCVRIAQPDFNNEILGGELPFKLNINMGRGKNNDLAESAKRKFPTLSLKKFGNGEEHVSVLDAPGIVAIRSTTVDNKKNVSIDASAPKELTALLSDFVEHFNAKAALTGSRVGSSSRISSKGAAKKTRNDKADMFLSQMNIPLELK